MLISDFKKEKVEAMKAHNANAVTALNAVVSKLMLLIIDKREKGQEVTDADSVTILQKVEKELIEEKLAFEKVGRAENVAALNEELATVRKYLPTMMTEDEITQIIDGLDDKSVPSVMRHFKTNFAGKCDMRMVNTILAKNK